MTSEEFVNDVIPRLHSAWRSRCLCDCAGFRKLLSFNFEDYDAGPMALLDSELVGEQIVRAIFRPAGDVVRMPDGEMRQRYLCPKCNTMCEEEVDEFSISMRRSYYRFPDSPDLADVGLYLVGIRAFSVDDFQRVHDFRPAGSIEEFLAYMGIAEPTDAADSR